jgi:hypothetical protein
MTRIRADLRVQYEQAEPSDEEGPWSRHDRVHHHVALIAIAAIGVITVFGDNIKGLFGISANALAGETDVKTADHTQKSKTDFERKKISNFGQNNGGAY